MQTGGGPAGSGSIMQLIPEDFRYVFIMNIRAARENRDNFPGDFDEFQDVGLGVWNDTLSTEGIEVEMVSELVIAAGDLYEGPYLFMLKGDFPFADIRDDWEDQDVESDSYLGYEIWDGRGYFLEDEGVIVGSGSESTTKDAIKAYDRGIGSLADANGSDMKVLLDKLGSSAAVLAVIDDNCSNFVSHCQGYGASIARSDPDSEQVTVDIAVLFSSERRAENTVDDYDDIADYMNGRLDNFASIVAINYGVADLVAVEIDDISANGLFVTATGTIELAPDDL